MLTIANRRNIIFMVIKMLKKKNKIIILVCIFALFIILFTPIPQKLKLNGGTAKVLSALTYKTIRWNCFEESYMPYIKTEFFIFPKNFNSTKNYCISKEKKLLNTGYGSTVTYATVKSKTNNYVIVTSINDNNKKDITIDKSSFIKVSQNIKFDDLKYETKLTIISTNVFSNTQKNAPSKLFKILPTDVEQQINFETINSQNTENIDIVENTSTNKENSSNINDSSNNINNSTENSKTDNTSKNQISNSLSSDVPSIDLPMYTPKGFWFQNVHKYPEHYDEKSKLLMPYLVVEPENYDPSKKYPVILYFHGAGDGYPEKESDEYEYQLRFNQRQAFQFVDGYIYCYEWLDQAIIIMPQCKNGVWWDFYPEECGPLDAAMRIFNKVTNEFSCDSSRFYVMGPSMGGYATLEVAAKYNNVFAAAMPSCAAWTCSNEKANLLKDMPILFLHGNADNLVDHTLSQFNYEMLEAVGNNNVQIKIYDGADHDLWRYSLKDDEPFMWLFSKKKQ